MRANGTVAALGDRADAVPVGLANVVAVTGGYYQRFALRADGTAAGWPVQVATIESVTDLVAIDMSGYYYALGLRSNGTVVVGTTWTFIPPPAANAVFAIPSGLREVVAIAAGNAHMLALRADGTVVAWGDNNHDQSSVPVDLAGVVAIDAGMSFSLALRADGTVVAWGAISSWQSSSPTNLTGVVAIAAGDDHALALRADGTVVAWGSGSSGETIIPGGLSGVVAIAAGSMNSLAMRADGTVVAWGSNESGPGAIPSDFIADNTARATLYVQEHDGTTWSQSGSARVEVMSGLRLTSPTQASFDLGASSSFQITATIVPSSITCLGLPPGLSVSASGLISGMPSVAGVYQVSITATLDGVSITGLLTIRVGGFGQFISPLYEHALGRNSDASGFVYWVNALGSRSGAEVAHEFLVCPEFRGRNLSDGAFVDALYRALLAREPESAGRSHWLGELARGVLREDVLYGFVLSSEFSRRCASLAIDATSTSLQREYQLRQFVRRFHQQCLSREPDEGGINNWTQGLLNGTLFGRTVAQGFVLSPEFTNRNLPNHDFVLILYRAFFNREPDSGGYAGWMAALNAGTSRSSVLDGFIGAQEFINLCNSYAILPFPPGG